MFSVSWADIHISLDFSYLGGVLLFTYMCNSYITLRNLLEMCPPFPRGQHARTFLTTVLHVFPNDLLEICVRTGSCSELAVITCESQGKPFE